MSVATIALVVLFVCSCTFESMTVDVVVVDVLACFRLGLVLGLGSANERGCVV